MVCPRRCTSKPFTVSCWLTFLKPLARRTQTTRPCISVLRELQLRCSSPSGRFAAGVKSWRVVGRIAGDNKLVGIKIGTFPTTSLAEARKMDRVILADMQKGLDPRQARHEAAKRRGRTVAIAWADYLEFYVDQYNRPKTAYDKRSTNMLRPRLGKCP